MVDMLVKACANWVKYPLGGPSLRGTLDTLIMAPRINASELVIRPYTMESIHCRGYHCWRQRRHSNMRTRGTHESTWLRQ